MENIVKAQEITGRDVAIMVDLKGPLIRTLAFKNNYSIRVKSG